MLTKKINTLAVAGSILVGLVFSNVAKENVINTNNAIVVMFLIEFFIIIKFIYS